MENIDIEKVFTYQPPKGDQPERYSKVREAAKDFAKIILECCPESHDRNVSLMKIRQSVMFANASIALE